ncbi:ArgP family transcriptional regulator [Paraburkholderia sp. RAU2J]|nr:ArgP family transcriptional regulator [Paraburkholderia sp. RAU2J]
MKVGAMLNMIELETFGAVVEHRSFTQAAVALNISSAAATRRVKRLEQSIGALLLIREPTVMPTKAGEDVFRHFMAVRLQEDDLLRRVTPGRTSTTALALAVNADSLATWFEPVTRELARHHVALGIVVDDQDHTLEALRAATSRAFCPRNRNRLSIVSWRSRSDRCATSVSPPPDSPANISPYAEQPRFLLAQGAGNKIT